MTTLISILCLLTMGFAGQSVADEPEIFLHGLGGNPAEPNRDVLWLDNPDFDANVGSSEVMAEIGLETEIANDFLLEEAATIEKVTWWGTYWGNPGEDLPLDGGMNLRFYNDAGCEPETVPFVEYLLPDDNCCAEYVPGGDGINDFIYEFCFGIPFEPGLYWFSAQHGDHPFFAQWGRLGADMTQMCDSTFRSAYFAYPDWVSCTDVFGDLYDASQMFEDVCEATPTERASWGRVKGLYR